MNKKIGLLFLGAALALGLGTFGFSNSMGTDDLTSLESGSYMVGHLTLTAYDENGNVKNYRQTDNVVINTADNCISEKIFTLTAGDGCTTNTNYDYIHIGTGSNSTTPKETWIDPLPLTFDSSLQAGAITLTNATGTGGAQTLLTASFTNVGATINEAAVRNALANGDGNVLAYQQFSDIVLGASDDLTVDWTITMDGN